MIRLALTPAVIVATLATGGCTSPNETDPAGTVKPATELVFLRLPAGAPPLFNDSVAFYARTTAESEGSIYFQQSNGEKGERFARLRIRSGGLFQRADGSTIGANDSILIVMKIVTPNELSLELRPSGLKFNPQLPAELKLEYEETGGDLHGDGRRDERDDAIEQKLAIWRQENPGDPLVKIGTVKTEDLRELEAKLTSFSRYFIAY